jgi:hypothetical protein
MTLIRHGGSASAIGRFLNPAHSGMAFFGAIFGKERGILLLPADAQTKTAIGQPKCSATDEMLVK